MYLALNLITLILATLLFYSCASSSAFTRIYEPNMWRFYSSAPSWFVPGSWDTYRRRMRFGYIVVSAVMSLLLAWGLCINIAAFFVE